MSYLLYDFSKIRTEGKFTLKCKDPLNPRDLIPVDIDRPSAGKQYNQSSLLSTVMTQLSRYAKKRDKRVSQEWMILKDNLSDLFKRRFLKDKRVVLDNEIFAKHINPVVKKLQQNGGIFQDLNITLRPLSETYTIHFFLKDICKVVLSKTNDADKCGQGISAWSKTLNAVFCPMFRAIEECFVKSLKDHIIYENGMKETEFDFKISELFDHEKKTYTNDFKEYDSKQNADTQFLEDIVLEMFVNPMLTKLYREVRLSAKQKSSVVTLINECLKNSGESATLFTNTILNMFFVALTTEVEDVTLEGYKGDDSVINAAEIRLVNQLLRFSVDAHLPMESSIDFPMHADFVGYYLSEFGIIPDIMKLLGKFLSKDFSKSGKKIEVWERERLGISDLPYFDQVKVALKDKLKFLNEKKLIYLKRIYRDLYALSDEAFEKFFGTYLYYCFEGVKEDIGYFSALAVSGSGYERDDLTEADKNKKRVAQFYGKVDNIML